MAKLVSVTTDCKAKNPAKCKYHTAVRNMNEALNAGDYLKYEEAKKLAEKHVNDKERRLFTSHTPEIANRVEEIATVSPTQRPKSITHLSLLMEDDKSVIRETVWVTAPETADTGTQCLECHKYLTLSSIHNTWDGDSLVCDHCKKKTPVGAGGPSLTKQALENLNPAVTKTSVWFHTTKNPNWYESISKESEVPVIHAGTMLAAWMRAKTLQGKSDDQFYIYEIRLNRDSEVSPLLYDEEDEYDYTTPMHPKTVEDTADGFETDKVMRYVNWWEDTGSVSIMASASLFTVSEPRKMDLSLPYKDQ